MPKGPRHKPQRRARSQAVPTQSCFNIDRSSGAYFLLSLRDGRRMYLINEPTQEPGLDLPSILTLLATGKRKVIVCAPPSIVVIELGDTTQPRDFFGWVAPTTVAAMQAQGWLRGDGVFELTDTGFAAAATTPSQEIVSH